MHGFDLCTKLKKKISRQMAKLCQKLARTQLSQNGVIQRQPAKLEQKLFFKSYHITMECINVAQPK